MRNYTVFHASQESFIFKSRQQVTKVDNELQTVTFQGKIPIKAKIVFIHKRYKYNYIVVSGRHDQPAASNSWVARPAQFGGDTGAPQAPERSTPRDGRVSPTTHFRTCKGCYKTNLLCNYRRRLVFNFNKATVITVQKL